uniref:Chromo domain-containing protein n=1 Tax=Panagrolaimus sp. JU765 TaxID=591449 RepID=A0AC34RQB3_9BILA
MFLVRWKGYGPEADSWEPEDILMEDASEVVSEFMEQFKNEKKKRSSRKRTTPSTFKTPSRASSVTSKKEDAAYLPENYDVNNNNNGKRKKTKHAGNSPSKSSPKTVPLITDFSRLNRVPWFMDSSSDSETESAKDQGILPMTVNSDNFSTYEPPATTTGMNNSLEPMFKAIHSMEHVSSTVPSTIPSTVPSIESMPSVGHYFDPVASIGSGIMPLTMNNFDNMAMDYMADTVATTMNVPMTTTVPVELFSPIVQSNLSESSQSMEIVHNLASTTYSEQPMTSMKRN